MSVRGRSYIALYGHFHAADEAESDSAITVDGGLAHRGHPELGIKLLGGGLHLMQGEHERPNLICLALPNRTLVLKFTGSGLGRLVPLNQAVVLGGELILVLGVPGVFLDALLGHLCQQLHLLREGLQLRINGSTVCERGLDASAFFKRLALAGKQNVDRLKEALFDLILIKIGGRAAFIACVLGVATPDGFSERPVGVPDLAAEKLAAVAAYQPGGEEATAAILPTDGLSAGELPLYHIPFAGRNDRRVAVLHIVLRNLALVFLHPFGEEVHGKGFLEESIALVLLVGEDTLHCTSLPVLFASWCWNALGNEDFGDAAGGLALNEKAVNLADDLCLLRDDFRQAVRAFAVTEELFVGQADLTVGKALSLAPGDILGDGAALLLGKAGHDGDQQLTLAVKGVDVFLLEIDLHAVLLQLANSDQTVYSISGEAADGLGNNEVDLPGEGIINHPTRRTDVLVVRLSVYLVLVRIPPSHATLIGTELLGLSVQLLGQRRSALQATDSVRQRSILVYWMTAAE